MPRDELRQPLRRRSLRERLWSRRPSALAAASVTALALFVTGGLWLARIPHPFAGEPVVMAQIPPVQDLTTASVTPPEAKDTAAGSADTEAVIARTYLSLATSTVRFERSAVTRGDRLRRTGL